MKYEPYPEYKDSGVEWIGNIPVDWETRKIKHFSENLDGRRVPISAENRILGQIPYYGATGIVDYVIDYIFDEELLLIGEDGAPFFDSYKDVAFVISGKSWINNHVHVLRVKNGFNIKFMMHILNQADYSLYIKGSTRDKLNQDQLKEIPILVPPKYEQNVIISFLNKKILKIDKTIEKDTQLIELLKEKRTALINHIVTKGLNPDAKMKDSGIEWIGKIPDEFEIFPLFALFKERKVKNIQNKENNVLSLSYGKIVRRNVETNFGLLPESFETYQIVEPGNIVLRLTDLQNDKKSLRTGLVKEKGIITSAYLAIEKIKDFDVNYTHYLLHAYDLIKIFYNLGGGVRQTMRYEDMKKMPILYPPIEEQAKISNFIDKKVEYIDNFVFKTSEHIQLLEQYKKSLIYQVVTGKVDVRGDDSLNQIHQKKDFKQTSLTI